MSTILAIDTASLRWIAVAIAHGRDAPLAKQLDAPRDQSRRLLAMIDDALAGDRTGLEAIVVVTGPGSFAGLRVGIATAQALGFALGVPVHGVGAFAAIRAALPPDLLRVDARHPMGRDLVAVQRFDGDTPSGRPFTLSAGETGDAASASELAGGIEVTPAARCAAAILSVRAAIARGDPPISSAAVYLREPTITPSKSASAVIVVRP